MQEKWDELYEKYLKEKLDTIFDVVEEDNKEDNNTKIEMIYPKIISSSPVHYEDVFGNVIGSDYECIWNFHDGYALVQKNHKYNYIDTRGNLLSKEWFNYGSEFSEGYAVVETETGYTTIDIHGDLGDKRYEHIRPFHEGRAAIWDNRGETFIDKKGQIIRPAFKIAKGEEVSDFYKGYSLIKSNYKYNYIDLNGNLVFDEWYDHVYEIIDGYAIVKLNGKETIVGPNGKPINDKWYDAVFPFMEGYAPVNFNGRYNVIDKNGKETFDKTYNFIGIFNNGYARVMNNFNESNKYSDLYKWNFINPQGELIGDTWYDEVESFKNGYAKVTLYKRVNLIRTDGKPINDKWYDEIKFIDGDDIFPNGYIEVSLRGKANILDTNGEEICNKWYDSITHFNNGYATVSLNGKYNYIGKDGKPIAKINGEIAWFDYIENVFSNGCAIVKNKRMYNFIKENGELGLSKWYDRVHFINDYFLVIEWVNGNRRCSYFDKDGNRICDWYGDIGVFKDGCAKIKVDRKYSYINTKGERINDEWYDDAEDFKDGYAVVKKKNKYTIIDTTGKPVRDCWWSEVSNFINGFARVDTIFMAKNGDLVYKVRALSNGYTCVSKDHREYVYKPDGTPVSDKWYERIDDYINGFCKVYRKASYNFIDINGNEISDKWYFEVSNFKDGYAKVYDLGKYNFIDEHGKEVSDCWYSYVRDFHDGYAVVTMNNKSNLIDSNCQPISDNWYDEVRSFVNGFAAVRIKDEWNFINEHGKEIGNIWYESVDNFQDGYSRVVRNHNCNFIDGNGQPLLDDWYNFATDFYCGLAWVKKSYNNTYLYNAVDRNGNFIFKKWLYDKYSSVEKVGNFSIIHTNRGNIKHYEYYDMGEYNVSKGLRGYKCSSKKDSFIINYEPVKKYGSNYIVCVEEKDSDKLIIRLYDREKNKYEELGLAEDVEFDNNLIMFNEKVYLMNGNSKLDITDYYKKYIKLRKHSINSNITILSKDDFFSGNEDEIRERARQAEREHQLAKRKQEEVAEKNRLYIFKIEQKQNTEDLEALKKDAILTFQSAVLKLEQYEARAGVIARVEAKHLLIDHGDHKEINPIYLEVGLKHINLSGMPLKQVKLSGIDFSDSNISFLTDDPMNVYNHDLSNSNFEGVHFLPGTIFTGVNIKGSKFTRDNDDKTMNITEESFADAIYDETTTLDGVPLTKLIEKEKESIK